MISLYKTHEVYLEAMLTAKEPYISAKEPYISAEEPYISTEEPCVYISAKEFCLYSVCVGLF